MLYYYKSLIGITNEATILKILFEREGPFYRLDGMTINGRLEALISKAGTQKNWSVVRLCSALLGKLVDSLAPSITTVLVRGKQVNLFNSLHLTEFHLFRFIIRNHVTPNKTMPHFSTRIFS